MSGPVSELPTSSPRAYWVSPDFCPQQRQLVQQAGGSGGQVLGRKAGAGASREGGAPIALTPLAHRLIPVGSRHGCPRSTRGARSSEPVPPGSSGGKSRVLRRTWVPGVFMILAASDLVWTLVFPPSPRVPFSFHLGSLSLARAQYRPQIRVRAGRK